MTASDRPTTVHLTYHHEDDSWWAESEQIPGLFAGGDNLDDAKTLARQVVADEFGDNVTLAEWMPMPSALEGLLVGSLDDEPPSTQGSEDKSRAMSSWPRVEGFSMDRDLGQEHV